MTRPLSASRKADREAIAAQFIAVAERHGAKIERRDEPRCLGFCGPGIALDIRLNGVGAQVDVNDTHGADYGLISWFNDYRHPGHATQCFSYGFQSAVGDPLAPGQRQHHKATSAASWELLAAYLSAGLRKAASGTAFEQGESA